MTGAPIIPGTLNLTAMRALKALRQTETDVTTATLNRPTDRIDFILEGRRLAAQGASVADIANALGVTTALIRTLLGPPKRRDSGARMAERPRKVP